MSTGRTKETAVFLAALVSLAVVWLAGASGMQGLWELRVLFGTYLIFIPAGYLFVSALYPLRDFGYAERIMLSISLSVPLVVLTVMFGYYVLGMGLELKNSLFLVAVVCILFYAVFIARNFAERGRHA